MKTFLTFIACALLAITPTTAQDSKPPIVQGPLPSVARIIGAGEVTDGFFEASPFSTKPVKIKASSTAIRTSIGDDVPVMDPKPAATQLSIGDCDGSDCSFSECQVCHQNGRRRIRPRRIGQSFFEARTQRACQLGAEACGAGDACATNDCCSQCCCGPTRYRSLFGGWTVLEDITPGTAPSIGFNDGFVLGTATGLYLNRNNRVEIEGSWRNNTLEADPANYGRINNYATMINVFHDFGNGPIKPYVGGGIGFALTKADFVFGGTAYEIDDYAFAYQGVAGVSFQKDSCRDLFVEYRFYGNTATDIADQNGVVLNQFDYLSHNLIFGIRFNR